MSLAFLAKKSWHTANLRNVEKVWIAEQKHAAEEKKVAELRKNIEEERQLQELRQLQASQGNKSAAIERVDWMYEGPSAAREKTAEEFLLGKEYNGEDEKVAKEDVNLSATTKYGSLALSKTTLPANDAFQRLNEDPMMLIRKRQQAAREQVLKNPVKMNRIKAKVDSLLEDKKTRKKAKKAAKKEKKHARREEKRRITLRNGTMESIGDRRADLGRHFLNAEEVNVAAIGVATAATLATMGETRNVVLSTVVQIAQVHNGTTRTITVMVKVYLEDEVTRVPRTVDLMAIDAPDESQRYKEAESRHKPIDVDGKYGLISKAGAVESKDVDKTSLGPNAKYLAKAREAKRLEEEERKHKLGKSSREQSCELTDEEKKRMAEQMVEDARQREEYIAKRATLKKEELDKREKEVTSSNPEFLRKLHSAAYLDGDNNMGDRLRRNKHYIQRNADSSNFLSK
ncbi:hypothetical protein JM16_004951 [Phytophthora kernoviae]|uniref:CBF1-interacting co-repressor CIR N-terminal domain-containing protein n=1 Tax=Phytophthora kernoviae TaxID=325452 RepID=A0A8T0LY26_9STRA|nr:hypothetical protein JM16_004951 [Phytophthora kernoviae]